MKCTKCGKNEVNFFYTSNINGNVTEHKLCTECAEEMGLMKNVFAESRQMMRGMFDGFFGRRSLLDSFFGGFEPFGLGARDFLRLGERKDCGCGDGCSCTEEKEVKAEVDPELAKRREINALRHRMKMAAEAEDFEKAAELRDKIRGMEG